jgi:Tfp pilus assembly PilM family ATPase
MSGLLDSLKDYFARGPVLSLSFMVTGRSLSCLYAPGRERRAGSQALLALKPGAVAPSFERANIKDTAELGEKIREALRRTQPAVREAALLVPESCLKSFILTFDEFPASAEERRELLLWRLKKQMPSLPEDVRLSFDLLGNGSPQRVFISVARPAVIGEYENMFAAGGLKVRSVGLPTLGLFNLLDRDREKDVLLANVEEDAVSLLAVLEGEPALYRFKPYLAGPGPNGPSLENSVIKEVAGTLTYLEDREKKTVKTLWLRGGLGADVSALAEAFQKKLSLPVRTLEPPASFGLTSRERHFLAPLLGYWA